MSVSMAHDRLRKGYALEPNPTLEVRLDRLDRLEKLLSTQAEVFVQSIDADFGGRSRAETLLADVVATLDSVRFARRHLAGWMSASKVAPHPVFLPGQAFVEPLPKGVVGILAPWNYPVNLALSPLVAALAAGCRALVKPSEATPRTASALGRAIRDHFSAEEVAVVEGGPEVAEAITRLPLDHLFFTGSTAVGRKVAAAAAENLVPLTLELGGKSPVLVHPDAPVAQVAQRVAVGKVFNAGQTCIAPDFLLLPRGKVEVFVEAFRDAVRSLGLQETAVASDRGLARLQAMIAEARTAGARVIPTGEDGPGRRMAPVLVVGAPEHSRLLTEEIFGPILPILEVDSLDEAIAYVRARPRPLACYVFDGDEQRARRTFTRLPCGGGAINDTLVHFGQEGLPFGGIGASGMGAYHGKAGFDTFTHWQPSLVASAVAPARRLLAAPYGPAFQGLMSTMIGRFGRYLG